VVGVIEVTVHVRHGVVATVLNGPLPAVVAGEAERSPIGLVKEQDLVAAVRSDVIDRKRRVGKERGVRDWAKDDDCYKTAALDAIEALLRAAPAPLTKLQISAIDSRVRTIFVNQQQGAKDHAR
jgi:hypothetical protein